MTELSTMIGLLGTGILIAIVYCLLGRHAKEAKTGGQASSSGAVVLVHRTLGLREYWVAATLLPSGDTTGTYLSWAGRPCDVQCNYVARFESAVDAHCFAVEHGWEIERA